MLCSLLLIQGLSASCRMLNSDADHKAQIVSQQVRPPLPFYHQPGCNLLGQAAGLCGAGSCQPAVQHMPWAAAPCLVEASCSMATQHSACPCTACCRTFVIDIPVSCVQKCGLPLTPKMAAALHNCYTHGVLPVATLGVLCADHCPPASTSSAQSWYPTRAAGHPGTLFPVCTTYFSESQPPPPTLFNDSLHLHFWQE